METLSPAVFADTQIAGAVLKGFSRSNLARGRTSREQRVRSAIFDVIFSAQGEGGRGNPFSSYLKLI